MLKAIKIRLYPNNTQAEQFDRLLGCCRFVYNKCLNKKITSYKENKISETRSSLGKYIHHDLLRDDNFAWLREQNTKVLKQALVDMLSAYNNFYKRGGGYPKFKHKHDNKQSCRFEIGAISKRNIYSSYKLSLANIKNIKFKCSKKYAEYLEKNKQKIKSATLTKLPCNQYYLSILIDGDLFENKSAPINGTVIGIDLGIKDFVNTSNGDIINNPHFKKSETHKLKRLQRQLSRKEKGSRNRDKARVKLAKVYKKISDKKTNYLHVVSNILINENQIICIEDLNVKGMVKNHNLAEAICEINFGEFRRIMKYKCNWYGRELVFVDRFYPSSKTCNNCGYINKKLKLSDREWVCQVCGKNLHRDYNAAMNIRDEGISKLVGSSTTELTLVDYPTMDDRVLNITKK